MFFYKVSILIFVIIFKVNFIGCENQKKEFGGQKNQKKFEVNKSDSKIPPKVYLVKKHILKFGKPMENYVGGRIFKNLEKRLPIFDEKQQKIKYREWDVNKKIKGKNRGKERLVSGSNGRFYYTNNHYKSFIEIKD